MKIDLNDRLVRFLVQEYVNRICDYQSEDELNFDVHKLIHTFTVVEMAQRLIRETDLKLSAKLKKQIMNAALLHDLGRCCEFKNGIRLKNFDHGKAGDCLIKKYFPKIVVETQATLFHNKLPSSKEPKTCQPVLDYVRDADMLANIQYEIGHLDTFMVHIFGRNSSKALNPVIDEEIIKAVQQKRPVVLCRIKENNLVTGFLWQLCWCYNLRTKAGKKIARKDKLFERFRDMICQKIVPLATADKKIQKRLIRTIQQIFPDKIFSDSI